jgi:hypothetical protein
MTEAQQRFIDRIDKLEARYKNDKYATSWMMDRELLIAVRDEMKQPVLFASRNADAIDFFQENGVDIS